MSLNFTDTLSLIDDICHTNSTTFATAKKTRYINLSVDRLLLLLFGEGAGGTWVLDDSNHEDEPVMYANLVASTRTYNFTTGDNGDLMLDIYKVYAKDSSDGVYKELTPVGFDDAPLTMDDGQDTEGVPTVYRKVGKGISLDLIPNYSSTNGLKLLVNREGTYFLTSDTTKKWGFTGLYHEYLVLSPSYMYARSNNLLNKNELKRDLMELESKIVKNLGQRDRDTKRRLIPKVENTR